MYFGEIDLAIWNLGCDSRTNFGSQRSPNLRDTGGNHSSCHAPHGHGEARPTIGSSSFLIQDKEMNENDRNSHFAGLD